MAQKRQIKIEILPDGTLKIDNAGNPNSDRIIKEIEKLALMLTGDPKNYVIEQHVHTHATAHSHTDGTVHSHN